MSCPVLSCPVCNIGVLWPNGWIDQDETWHGGRPWPRPHWVRWGPSSPHKGHSPRQFSAHVRCGQTAGWIKMPLGMEVGLVSGDIVLDGDPTPSPQKRGHSSLPIFGQCIVAKRLDNQVATWYRGRPWPRQHCVIWGRSTPNSPNFQRMSIVAKQLDGLRCHLV